MVSRRSHFARRRRCDALAADQPGIRDAANQGRGMRQASGGQRREAKCQQGPAGRAGSRLSHRRGSNVLSRYLGRAAIQARLSPPDGGGALARESCGGAVATRPLATWHSFARPTMRQRNHRHRGGADRLGHRSGVEAHLRLSEARLVRWTRVAEDQAGDAAPHACRRRCDHLCQRRRRSRHSPVPHEHRSCRSRWRDRR